MAKDWLDDAPATADLGDLWGLTEADRERAAATPEEPEDLTPAPAPLRMCRYCGDYACYGDCRATEVE